MTCWARSLKESTHSIFIPNPRHAENPNIQVCDALLIEGDTLVIIEYKANMFSAASKYSGDHIALQKEIETKYVHSGKRKKGLTQLAHAIRSLFTDSSQTPVLGFDPNRIRRVCPVLVTLDEIGGSLLMSALLNTYFNELLPIVQRSVEILPLFCLDIESLEVIAGNLSHDSLSAFLLHWLNHDPSLRSTLLAFLKATAIPSPYLAAEWENLYADMGKILFPDEFASGSA